MQPHAARAAKRRHIHGVQALEGHAAWHPVWHASRPTCWSAQSDRCFIALARQLFIVCMLLHGRQVVTHSAISVHGIDHGAAGRRGAWLHQHLELVTVAASDCCGQCCCLGINLKRLRLLAGPLSDAPQPSSAAKGWQRLGAVPKAALQRALGTPTAAARCMIKQLCPWRGER